MNANYSAPWHRASFDKLIHERLPELLAERGPLLGYHVDDGKDNTCRISVTLAANGAGDITLTFELPQPDADGLFHRYEHVQVVVPTASSEYLENAEIRCIGEQLYDYLGARLTTAPADMLRDEASAHAWLPLDAWWNDFLNAHAQWLDMTNWLAQRTHLRRLFLPEPEYVITPDQFGRVCPFETPEGPNIGHIFSLAVGADIRDGKLVIVDARPEAALGLTASMMPFLEHNDANRLLFGVNMMRQWRPPINPEPAIVQTGNEPAEPGFWCGINLLTAFVSWGPDTYEDGILISESAAQRLQYTPPVEPGDKFSNRHGAKGVISRIVPDDEMPRLADGTPVELACNFIALHARMNFGQVREAVMSRIAQAEGQPAMVAPFRSPDEEELRRRLARAGLPEDGMEQLTLDGQLLERRSLVGWIYWGRTVHIASEKIHAAVTPDGSGQRQGEMEYYGLRDAGAFENIRETYNTRAAGRPDAGTLAEHVTAGPIAQAPPPAPQWEEVARQLSAMGIQAVLMDERITFRFADAEDALPLARPVPHPWLRERELTAVRVLPNLLSGAAVVESNARLARMLASGVPDSLLQRAAEELAERVNAYADELLLQPNSLVGGFEVPDRSSLLRFGARVLFSGRTVLAPALDLRLDQLGVAEEIAWIVFGPLVRREIGNAEEVAARSERAAAVLDAIMARSWVILNRAPTFMPTALLAFHPVRVPDRVFRLHPLACMLMNADFDGDQAALFLPLTEEAQREAGERLSIAAHLRRDPELLKWLYPNQEMLWGLATHSLTPAGQSELANYIGPEGFVTRDSLTKALCMIMQRDGVDAVLETAQRLMIQGFSITQHSGASISPVIGETLHLPAPPDGNLDNWNRYVETCFERLAAHTDLADDLGPQLLAVKTGARGNLHSLLRVIGPWGTTADVAGQPTIIRHGFRDGLTSTELFATVPGAREGLAKVASDAYQMGAYGIREPRGTRGFTVLARAMRAEHPGLVFAHAAATGEIDPLTDPDSRLFVGLPV